MTTTFIPRYVKLDFLSRVSQHFFDLNESLSSLQMMECGECKAWVHAKCEGLSDEKYQVLSYLPETVEYICRWVTRKTYLEEISVIIKSPFYK